VVAVIVESLTTTTLVASSPFQNVTSSVPVNPVPVMVMEVPPAAGPEFGEIPVIVTGPVLLTGPESPPWPRNVVGSEIAMPIALPTATQAEAVTHETPVNPAL
jgi:hypothetical protein